MWPGDPWETWARNSLLSSSSHPSGACTSCQVGSLEPSLWVQLLSLKKLMDVLEKF